MRALIAGLLARLVARIARRRHRVSARVPAPMPPAPAVRRQALRLLAALLPLLGAIAFLAVVLGLVPIKASSGHWAITEFVLQFAKRRAVVMQSMAIHTPPLDDDALVLKGAGHYEGGCRPCHGAPGSPRPAIPMQMTPKPPDLASRAAAWKPRELFHIVKHGIKFTGMPAWPAARRDDEVWAVVAFLVRMPGLEPDAYRRLVRGEAAVVPAVAQLASPEAQQEIPPAVTRTCGRCHGAEGNGRGDGAFPRLAGQRPQYLLAALDAYARGDRFSGIMGPIAAALAPAERDEVAAYYATLAPQPGGHAADHAAAERGAALARDGIPGQRVPSCEDCHGFSTHPRNPSYPVLHGQHADYLELQLRLFAEGRRGGSPYARLMHSFAARLTPPQIRDLAEHYAAGPEGSPTARSGRGVTSASSP